MRNFAAAVLVFVVGLAGGYFLFSSPRGSHASDSAAQVANDAADQPDSLSARSAQSTDSKAQRLVTAARRKGGTAMERQNELYLAIEALSAEDIRRLLTDIGAVKAMIEGLAGIDQQTSRHLASGLAGRWLKVDPEGAMKWLPRVLELVPKGDWPLVLDAIAAKRPEELLGLVSSQKKASEREDIISRALAELAAKDLPRAQAWLNACSDLADRKVAEKAMRRGIVKADPLRLVEIASGITDTQERAHIASLAAQQAAEIGPGMLRQLATQPLKSWMLPLVLNHFAQHDPELAVDLALKCESEGWERNSALQSAFGALAARDHEMAIARLKDLQGKEQASAVAQIAYRWSTEEPEAALAWLAEKPASARIDPNRGSYGSSDALLLAYSDWAGNAPDAALAWADALPPGETRDAIQAQRARILSAKGEVAEATRILSQLGSTADPMALSTIASAWAQRDPAAAAEWAINQSAGTLQDAAIATVVRTWANDDPRSAATWLEQFPPGETRDRSIVSFLGRSTTWTASPETQIAEFDLWFDRIDDPWQRSQAAIRSYHTRRGVDPQGAREWLLSVPNVDPGPIRLALMGERR